MLYYQLIERYLNSDKKVFRDEMNAYSTNEINEMVSRMCILMDKWKLEKQDIVLIVGKNSIECVVTILSCIAKGIILAICSKDNADFAGKECSAKCRMGDEGISSLISEKKITWKEIMTIVPRRICRTQVDIKEICYILYTSGSTANPKGVVARYENVMFCIDSISSVLKYEYNDRILNCLPIYFDYGLYQILMAFWNHIELVMVNKYVIQQLPSLIGKYQITIFPVVPTMVMLMFSLNRLNVKNIKSLRMITSTGDVLPVSIINRIYSVLPDVYIVPMYGLTECKRTSVMPLNRRDKILSGSCGLPLPGTRVFLDSVDKNGIGELMICGPNVMVGYWNSPIETAERFLARGGERILKSGDLFCLDDEGFLYFKGRINRMIKSSGYRISNADLEHKLSYLNSLIECRIVGLEDPILGEKIALFIYSLDKDIVEKIKLFVSDWPIYMRPHYVIKMNEEFLLNTNGKVDDKLLRSEMGRGEVILRLSLK